MTRVAFRVDSGSVIGSGHFVRCLTLAAELRRRGAEIRFVCANHAGNLVASAQRAGIGVSMLPSSSDGVEARDGDYGSWRVGSEADDAAATLEALGNWRADWFVVDHYALGSRWEDVVAPHAEHLLAIDDIGRPHVAHVVLDQNWFGAATLARYDGRLRPDARALLGPRYALLQPEYARLHTVVRPRGGDVRRVMVYFGGTDAPNYTASVLRALSFPALSAIAVDVVVGPNHADAEGIAEMARRRPGTTVHRHVPSLSELMARADLAIGGGGATTWERACLALPSIVTVLAPNQRELSRALATDGVHVLVDDETPQVDRWYDEIRRLVSDPARRTAMAERAATLTDGRGVLRVARVLLGRDHLSLALRDATLCDEGTALEWANDPETRAASFSVDPIARDTHADWFRRKIADPDVLFLVGEDEAGLPLGQVRFELQDRAAEAVISISVDACARGLGVGPSLLGGAMERWRTRPSRVPVIAEVRSENARSVNLFLRAGFVEIEPRRPAARCFVHRTGSSRGGVFPEGHTA